MKIVAIDFDGVINPYLKGFQGNNVFEDPSDTCRKEMLELQAAGWTICINTCRSEVKMIRRYLLEHQIPFDHINYSPRNDLQNLSRTKMAADVYIDDKGITFEGKWHGMAKQVMAFQPFYKRSQDGEIKK